MASATISPFGPRKRNPPSYSCRFPFASTNPAYIVGTEPKNSISAFKSSRAAFIRRMVRSAIVLALGSSESTRSRACAESGVATPPGTTHEGCTRSCARPSMTCNPNLRSSMPSRASSGCAAITPSTFRLAGSESMPSRKSGDDR